MVAQENTLRFLNKILHSISYTIDDNRYKALLIVDMSKGVFVIISYEGMNDISSHTTGAHINKQNN